MTTQPAFHLVLVHGIGDRKPGAVLKQAADGIRRTFGKSGVQFRGEAEPAYQSRTPAGTITVASGILEAGNKTIALSEFHWGTVTGPIRLSNPLDAIRNFAGVLQVLPTLALSSTSPPAAKRVARVIGWLEAAACILMLLSAVAFSVEILLDPALMMDNFSRQGTGTASSGGAAVAVWVPRSIWILVGGLVIVYLVLFLILPYLFLRYVAGLLEAEKRASYSRLILAVGAATVLNVLSLLTGLLLFSGVFLLVWGASQGFDAEDIVGSVLGTLFLLVLVWGIANVTGLVRDVAIYLGRDAGGEELEVQHRIQDELLGLISKIQIASPNARIVLVCHSLGTVIATDLLHREATRTGGARLTLDLVTAGSPLRRMVHRLLPQRALAPPQLRTQLRDATPIMVKRWFNCFRILDFVGQSLSYSFYCVMRVFLRRKTVNDPTVGINENLLNPLQGWRIGHGNYWADERFVRFIAFTVLELGRVST